MLWQGTFKNQFVKHILNLLDRHDGFKAFLTLKRYINSSQKYKKLPKLPVLVDSIGSRLTIERSGSKVRFILELKKLLKSPNESRGLLYVMIIAPNDMSNI